ncbi:MAG: S1C family serine protease [Chloroflexota bacterium]
MRAVTRIAVFVVFGLLLGVALTVGYFQSPLGVAAQAGVGATATAAPPSASPAPSTARTVPVQQLFNEDIIAGVYERVSPSVVNITSSVNSRSSIQDNQQIPYGTGSGFIVDNQGRILTNNHVVAEADGLSVTFADGTTVNAKVLGRDPASDLAVIQADLPEGALQSGKVAIASLGDSDQVRVGQLAIAIGNPFGYDRTATVGIISGLGRDIPAENNRAIRGGIQTDAAINPGNSGGPLLNSAGEVIGINSAIESPVQGSVGIGFAVPVNTAKRYLNTLIAGGDVQHPWLGIRGTPVTQTMVEQLGLSVKKGIYTVEVTSDSPAAKAGLRGAVASGQTVPSNLPAGGDVIAAVDGQEVTDVTQLASYLDLRKGVGDTVELKVNRGGQELTLQVTLVAWPDNLQ